MSTPSPNNPPGFSRGTAVAAGGGPRPTPRPADGWRSRFLYTFAVPQWIRTVLKRPTKSRYLQKSEVRGEAGPSETAGICVQQFVQEEVPEPLDPGPESPRPRGERPLRPPAVAPAVCLPFSPAQEPSAELGPIPTRGHRHPPR